MHTCIYELFRMHPPKHMVSTTPPKRHGFSRYRCADIEVLMCWYWSIDALIHSHVNACLHKPQGSHSQSIMSNTPPKRYVINTFQVHWWIYFLLYLHMNTFLWRASDTFKDLDTHPLHWRAVTSIQRFSVPACRYRSGEKGRGPRLETSGRIFDPLGLSRNL